MGAGVDVIFIYIHVYVNTSWILTYAIRVHIHYGVLRNRAEDNSCKSIYQDQHPSVFQDLFKSRKYSNSLKCIKPDVKGI
jgi:hypothetical protein